MNRNNFCIALVIIIVMQKMVESGVVTVDELEERYSKLYNQFR